MNKRLVRIVGGSLLLLVSTLIGILLYDNNLHKHEGMGLNRPDLMGSYYRDSGYFKIDPKTILASLESGDTNVFIPLLEDDALELDELTNLSIDWTQADFLKIASALGQVVWSDPMNLKDWNVYSISFDGSCSDPIGFDFASITYFKTGKNSYMTRLIEVEPFFGRVEWGGGRTHPQPILRKWKRVDLTGAKITADDALLIANEDVKKHFQIIDNFCYIMVDSSRFDPNDWGLYIDIGSLDTVFYTVNLYTGDLLRKTK
jgi:hypothetical protein